MWLAMDHVQFYQSWVSRSIESYSPNIFLLPLDYTQSTVEEMFWPNHKGKPTPYQDPFMKNVWKYVHPASYLRFKTNQRKARQQELSALQDDDDSTTTIQISSTKKIDPIAPWDYDIFKCKLICFCANNKQHFGLFAALNPSKLVYGDEKNELECGLLSLDSMSGCRSPLPRETRWLDYMYFLLNVCHDIHEWVIEQDENDVESLEQPELNVIFDSCMLETKSENGGFFNRKKMQPERLPSAKQQMDGYNCGVFASLNWSMFVEVEPDKPSLCPIKSLHHVEEMIVKPFWDCQPNTQDRLVHFRYKLCRLMEYFLQKHLSQEKRSYIAIGRNPLPTDWTYPEELSVGFHYPPCVGGLIPKDYEKVADLSETPAPEEGRLPPDRVHVDHYGFNAVQECSNLSDSSEEELVTLGPEWIKDMNERMEWEKYIIQPSLDTKGATKRDLKL